MAASVSVSVPIWLSLTRIELPTLLVDAAAQALGVGDEEIVADELDAVAQALGQFGPARPVILGQPILDADDRVGVRPLLIEAIISLAESVRPSRASVYLPWS